MLMVVDSRGDVRCLYGEEIDLHSLGHPVIHRASHVEPDESGNWWADLTPVKGPKLGPFSLRSDALQAERFWLEVNWLTPSRRA